MTNAANKSRGLIMKLCLQQANKATGAQYPRQPGHFMEYALLGFSEKSITYCYQAHH